ncbi:uncharacterized protein M6B38_381395 [Iris pallida]|uniref:Uncharacterized protein n=1 Tax=Iris pallida TaxID=29817 RepID=A0AAX6G8E3_IRIPA|nr:Uncharacterized protein M6B38_245140 [Iris pallida]KAJ6824461.1 uncharacterized protein M6B38_381395 [Iris pallida]
MVEQIFHDDGGLIKAPWRSTTTRGGHRREIQHMEVVLDPCSSEQTAVTLHRICQLSARSGSEESSTTESLSHRTDPGRQQIGKMMMVRWFGWLSAELGWPGGHCGGAGKDAL